MGVLSDVEAQANDACWCLPLKTRLAHGAHSTFVHTINELDNRLVNILTAYETTLEKVTK